MSRVAGQGVKKRFGLFLFNKSTRVYLRPGVNSLVMIQVGAMRRILNILTIGSMCSCRLCEVVENDTMREIVF